MSFEEKKAWAFAVVAVIAYGTYLVVVLAARDGGPLASVDYGPVVLATVGGAILAGIVAGVVLTVATPEHARRTDQRDREIARLGEHVGQAFLVLGGVGALLLSVRSADHFWIANVLYLGFVLSAVVGSSARLVAYRRGVPAW